MPCREARFKHARVDRIAFAVGFALRILNIAIEWIRECPDAARHRRVELRFAQADSLPLCRAVVALTQAAIMLRYGGGYCILNSRVFYATIDTLS